MIHYDRSALLQAPPSLQHVAGAVQRLLLRPALTAGVAALFRPVLLPLASALVDSRLSGARHAEDGLGEALEASHGAVAVALITLTELAPHLSGCAGGSSHAYQAAVGGRSLRRAAACCIMLQPPSCMQS